MGRFVKGDVVVIPFPVSDLSATKRRPALMITVLPDDVILYQITSHAIVHRHAISITANDFTDRSLHQDSDLVIVRLLVP